MLYHVFVLLTHKEKKKKSLEKGNSTAGTCNLDTSGMSWNITGDFIATYSHLI